MGGICAIEPLHTGHGDDVNVLVGVTNNSIVDGSLNSPFLPVVQVCNDNFFPADVFVIPRVGRKLLGVCKESIFTGRGWGGHLSTMPLSNKHLAT